MQAIHERVSSLPVPTSTGHELADADVRWRVSGDGKGLELVRDGAVLGTVSRWADNTTKETVWWGVDLPGRGAEPEEAICGGLVEACVLVLTSLNLDGPPPDADLLAENGETWAGPGPTPGSTPPPVDGKSGFDVRCGECGHVWTLFYAPLPLSKMGRVMSRACCPSCASGADHIEPVRA